MRAVNSFYEQLSLGSWWVNPESRLIPISLRRKIVRICGPSFFSPRSNLLLDPCPSELVLDNWPSFFFLLYGWCGEKRIGNIYIYIFNFVVPSVRVGLRWVGFFCFSNWEQKRYKIIVDHIYGVIIDVCNLISESRPMYIFVCSLKFHEYVNSLNWMDFTFFVCFKLLKRQIGRYLI